MMTDSRQPLPPGHRDNQARRLAGETRFCYLPVNESLRRWEIYLTSVGQSFTQAGQKYPPQGHPAAYHFNWASGRILPEYAVVLITGGAGEYEFRNHPPGRCRTGDVLLIAPGQWHRYRPLAATGWSELWICLGGEYLHRLQEKKLIFHQPCLPSGTHFAPLRQAMLSLQKQVGRAPNANSLIHSGRAMEIIARVAESAGRPLTQIEDAPAQADPQVRQAIEFIWNNSHRPLSTGDVALAVGAVVRTLERRFAACHDRGIREEIEWSRFIRARRMLQDASLPVKQVAYASGFGDSRRMIAAFRRLAATTPSQLRSAGPARL